MSDSESYITVLIGIVMGMSIVRIISFVGKLITYNKRTSMYWVHLVWLLGLLLLIVQSWWAMHTDWNFANVESLTMLCFLLISPILLYLLSAVLCPNLNDSESVDLEIHHVKVRVTFYTLLGLLFLVLIPEAVWMSSKEVNWESADNIFRVLAAILFFISPHIIRKWEKFEYVVPIAVVGLLMAHIILVGPLNNPIS